jgi:hypothetical protein
MVKILGQLSLIAGIMRVIVGWYDLKRARLLTRRISLRTHLRILPYTAGY